MRSDVALVAAGCAALALVAAAGAVAAGRQRDLELSPVATVENGAPRGLLAARAWLAATGRPWRVLGPGDPAPSPGEVLLLVAPRAPLSERDAALLVAHAEGGGLLVWAMGEMPQPTLERRLGVTLGARASDVAAVDAPPLAPHPLFDGLVLRTGGATLSAAAPSALAVAGRPERPAAIALPLGAGEAVALAGPDVLENFRLGEGENVALLARLASLGRIVFDERHLLPPSATASPASRRTLALALAQALLVAAVLLLAIGRRLGAVRELAVAPRGRSVADYLGSLGDLYRRAGGERELAHEAWRALRLELERRSGIPARAGVEEAAARLELARPAAAAALRRAAAGRDAGSLLETTRAAAALESSLRREGGKRAL